MRCMLLTLTLVVWAATARAGIVGDYGDILFWAGSGTNQAALVLDFGTTAPQGSPPAVAWGYRWNGTANLDDMVFSLAGTISGSGAPSPVAGSDPRLGIDAPYSNTYQSYFVRALTYDQVGLPAGWSQDVRSLLNDFDNDLGIAQYGAATAGGTWPTGGTLDLAPLGLADTVLVAGGWYGYVVALYDPLNDYALPETFVFSQPTAAVPEPSCGVLLAGVGAAVVLVAARRRRSRLIGRPPDASPGPRSP